MSSGTASAAPGTNDRRHRDVPQWRLYLLRAMFAVFVAGGFFAHLPWLFDPDLTRRGMLDCLLVGLWLMSFFGLRYPLQMLPIFLFEFAWKSVWLLTFGLPKWMAGQVDPQLREDLWLIGAGPIVFGLIIPWGYVWRHYFKQPAERWRYPGYPSGNWRPQNRHCERARGNPVAPVDCRATLAKSDETSNLPSGPGPHPLRLRGDEPRRHRHPIPRPRLAPDRYS